MLELFTVIGGYEKNQWTQRFRQYTILETAGFQQGLWLIKERVGYKP